MPIAIHIDELQLALLHPPFFDYLCLCAYVCAYHYRYTYRLTCLALHPGKQAQGSNTVRVDLGAGQAHVIVKVVTGVDGAGLGATERDIPIAIDAEIL